jgi:hypothetical protein
MTGTAGHGQPLAILQGCDFQANNAVSPFIGRVETSAKDKFAGMGTGEVAGTRPSADAIARFPAGRINSASQRSAGLKDRRAGGIQHLRASSSTAVTATTLPIRLRAGFAIRLGRSRLAPFYLPSELDGNVW